MNSAVKYGRLAALGLLIGSMASVGATTAQAARNVVTFSPYDPTFAYTGDPAYAPGAQALERNATPVHSRTPHFRAPANEAPNLPYPDRPYGDPDRW